MPPPSGYWPGPCPANRDRAASREPRQRRHRAGDLRPRGRGHGRRRKPRRCSRRRTDGARLRWRGRSGRPGRPGELAGAPSNGRSHAREHHHPRRPLRRVPARRLDSCVRRSRRRDVRAAHEPALSPHHQRDRPPTTDRILVARDNRPEQRAVRTRRAAGPVRCAQSDQRFGRTGPRVRVRRNRCRDRRAVGLEPTPRPTPSGRSIGARRSACAASARGNAPSAPSPGSAARCHSRRRSPYPAT